MATRSTPASERRTLESQFEVRVEGDTARIRGYAAKFDTLSGNLGGFVETIERGAFDDSINRRHDVRALFNHDPNIVLGRTKNGTLNLKIDEEGLRYEALGNMGKQSVRDLVADIERGDVDQSSFGFRTLEDDWGVTDEDYPLRILKRVRLYDVSPATIPAYSDTTVAVRSLAEVAHLDLDELVAAAGRDELRDFLLSTSTASETVSSEVLDAPKLQAAMAQLWERKR